MRSPKGENVILPNGWTKLKTIGIYNGKNYGCSFGRCKQMASYIQMKQSGLGFRLSGFCRKCGDREMKKK